MTACPRCPWQAPPAPRRLPAAWGMTWADLAAQALADHRANCPATTSAGQRDTAASPSGRQTPTPPEVVPSPWPVRGGTDDIPAGEAQAGVPSLAGGFA